MNSRTKGNDTLRQKLKVFLDTIPSGKEIYTNHLVSELSKLHRNYSISSSRISSLLKEFTKNVRWVKAGVWVKI